LGCLGVFAGQAYAAFPGADDAVKQTPNTTVPAATSLRGHHPAGLSAAANAVGNYPGCEANVLPANDDGSTEEVSLPFTLNFFGTKYSSLWVNNNGNVTFGGPLAIYTPFEIGASTPPIIAPFLADVDTRGFGSGLVTYGVTTFQGHAAFCVDWPFVGYYEEATDRINNFQLLLVNRADAGAGDFDIVFNYGQIQWETGDASGGSDGLGGVSASAGYSSGDGVEGDFYQLPGSLQNGAFLDGGEDSLTAGSYGSGLAGRYIFHITGHPSGPGVSDGFLRPWPPGGYGYSFRNRGLSAYLHAAQLALGDALTEQGLEGVFSDWARDAAASGGQSASIARLGRYLNGGLCFGLALSGGRFDSEIEALLDPAAGRSDGVWGAAGTGPSATVNLPGPGAEGSSTEYDRQLLRLISDDFVTQFSTQVNTSLQRQHYAYADPLSGTEALASQLESIMADGQNLYDPSGQISTPAGNGFAAITLQARVPGGWSGHEVLAYSLDPLAGGAFQIDVWDNNFPLHHYAIDVYPNDTWTYDAPYPSGDFGGTLSMAGAPGLRLGLLAALPLFKPSGLNYFPHANGGLGTGSLVDLPPGTSALEAADEEGNPVDTEVVASEDPTVGDDGQVLDFPSDAGSVTLEGAEPSLQVRGASTYMTADPGASGGPPVISEDEQAGKISASDSPGTELSVTRHSRVATSNGAGGLQFAADGSLSTSDDSANLDLTLEFDYDGAPLTATLYSGSAAVGGGVSFSPADVAAAEANAIAVASPPLPAGQPGPLQGSGEQQVPAGRRVKCGRHRKKRRVHGHIKCVKTRKHRGRHPAG
jgi:Nidogen-like